ncbi:MAG: hypothetical protein WD990_08400 [Acidimicrobiia bacterium]
MPVNGPSTVKRLVAVVGLIALAVLGGLLVTGQLTLVEAGVRAAAVFLAAIGLRVVTERIILVLAGTLEGMQPAAEAE